MKLRSFLVSGSVVALLIVGCNAASQEEIVPNVDPTTGIATPLILARTSNGPDLTVDGERLKNSVDIVQQNISANSCAVQEGCVTGTGKRKLLRFDVLTPNIGNADVHMGSPRANPTLYDYSACHRHYHLRDYAKYELLDKNGNTVMLNGSAVIGRKQAFCLMDSMKYDPSAPTGSSYDCSDQGISAGYADLYYKTLDCQWIDITGVPNSDPANGVEYQLRVTINGSHVVDESGPAGDNYANNTVTVPVSITDPTGQNGGRPRPAR